MISREAAWQHGRRAAPAMGLTVLLMAALHLLSPTLVYLSILAILTLWTRRVRALSAVEGLGLAAIMALTFWVTRFLQGFSAGLWYALPVAIYPVMRTVYPWMEVLAGRVADAMQLPLHQVAERYPWLLHKSAAAVAVALPSVVSILAGAFVPGTSLLLVAVIMVPVVYGFLAGRKARLGVWSLAGTAAGGAYILLVPLKAVAMYRYSPLEAAVFYLPLAVEFMLLMLFGLATLEGKLFPSELRRNEGG